MKIAYNLKGAERKNLVTAVSEIMGWEPVYKGAPTFAYAVNNIIIDKDSTVICESDEASSQLLQSLTERGFRAETAAESETEENIAPKENGNKTAIEMPGDGFSDTAMANLENLVTSKGSLIKKALGVDSLPIERTESIVAFPWFTADITPEETDTYIKFIALLHGMAKNQKRVNTKENSTENEKFSFRVFLIRLGMVGDEYKSARKILLSKLSGNSAFLRGNPNQNSKAANE